VQHRGRRIRVVADAVDRSLAALRFFHDSDQTGSPEATGYKGFYYHFLDMHSGARLWRSERGYCLMIGGEEAAVQRLDPVFVALAPSVEAAPRLPPAVRARVSVEAASPFGWERYVGPGGAIIGVDRFGASAPGSEVMARYGFTVEHVVATAKAVLARSPLRKTGEKIQ
jgi:hypothetical protein